MRMWMYRKMYRRPGMIRWSFWVSPYATRELFPANKREGKKVCLGSYGDGAGCMLGFQLVLCTLKNTKGLGKLHTLKQPFMVVAAHTPPDISLIYPLPFFSENREKAKKSGSYLVTLSMSSIDPNAFQVLH